MGTSDPDLVCSESVDQVLDKLESHPQVELYLCIHSRQSAGPVIMERLKKGSETDGIRNRLSRALAVWLLGQTHREFTGSEVRALSPADRNFLSDGIYARRGRETACTRVENLDPRKCPHGEAFKHFDWYRPVASYNNHLLSQTDRDNLLIIKDPPPAPEAEEEAVVVTPAEAPETESGSCGCSAGSGTAVVGLLALVPLMGRFRS